MASGSMFYLLIIIHEKIDVAKQNATIIARNELVIDKLPLIFSTLSSSVIA